MVSLKGDWWPKTNIGRQAVWLSLTAVVWGMLMPVPYWLVMAGVIESASAVIAVLMIVVELVITMVAFTLSANAVFKQKERNIASMLTFAFLCLISGFWLFFIVGEFAFPH